MEVANKELPGCSYAMEILHEGVSASVRKIEESEEVFSERMEEFESVNCRFLTIFGQTVSKKYLHFFLNSSANTPKKAWDALVRQFESSSTANKMQLQRQLFRFEMKTGVSIESHVKEFSELLERCVSLDITIQESQKCCALLCSLPDDRYVPPDFWWSGT